MEFKDRTSEIKSIKKLLNSNKFEFLILYGRRRIGKTELILKTTQNRKRLYYFAVEQGNLERFYNACLEYDSKISNLKKDFGVLFEYLKDKAEVVIIDEFQNMIKEDKNILNLFQEIIDIRLKGSKLKLIILGSSVSMINSRILDYKSPLYGRRTGTMKLNTVPFFELKKFFPKMNINELIEAYSFADGIPYYLIKIEDNFFDWFSKEIKNKTSFLLDEIDFLMKYEFEDSGTYKLILEALSFGKTKINEIKDYIKVKRTDLSPYIQNLTQINMIRREIPITENIKSRNGRYYLNDNFLKFWFKFIYPNLNSILEGIFNVNIIKKEYNSYLGFIFEEIAKQYLIRNKLIDFDKIGGWWYKEVEIDLIALNENKKKAVFIECKWSNNVIPEEVLKELSIKSKKFEWNKESRKEAYIIFAKSFSRKINEFEGRKVYCLDLKDLEKSV